MNLILIEPEMLVTPEVAELTGRHYEHAMEVLKFGEREGVCRVGMLNGLIGVGKCLEIDRGAKVIRLAVDFCMEPPAAMPLILVAAMQRPQTLKKVVHAAVTMGVKRLVFIHAAKVEKSYWQSPQNDEAGLMPEVKLALEQTVDTVMPKLEFHRKFKVFAEDELPKLAAGTRILCAHPTGAAGCPVGVTGGTTLLVGPEGGFTEYEVEVMREQGAECVTMGRRILRTEVAVTALLSRLYPSV